MANQRLSVRVIPNARKNFVVVTMRHHQSCCLAVSAIVCAGLLLVLPVVVIAGGRKPTPGAIQASISFREQRIKMVETQIEGRGVTDKQVLEAMLKVPRHLFVPERYRVYAYADQPLPIGQGQTISQPYIVAFMTEALSLKKDDKVLEIGTGSGYQAAVLSEIAKEVYTIEIVPELAESAEECLKSLGYGNVHVKCGDGYLGWPENAPFDAIIVTCAPDEIPQALVNQLAEGGRIVLPVGARWTIQKLILAEKIKGQIVQRTLLPVRFVPMIHGDKTK